MNDAGGFDLPAELEPVMRRAERLEWVTLAALSSIVAVMYATRGNSQAMKAAWVEDLLSFVAPVAFLVSARFRHRPADDRFPYGYHRSVSIAFLAGAVSLTILGTFILIDSVLGLIRGDRPTLGLAVVAGQPLWSGWLMMLALAYSAVLPLMLGRAKLGLARRLHDKALHADAAMNRADWMTACAGILGIAGVASGWWWADGAAGGIISIAIVKDGAIQLKRVVADLMDRRPLTVDGELSTVPDEVRAALLALPWVAGARVRLREEGHVFIGETFLVAHSHEDLPARVRQARAVARSVDWRVHDIVVEIGSDRARICSAEVDRVLSRTTRRARRTGTEGG